MLTLNGGALFVASRAVGRQISSLRASTALVQLSIADLQIQASTSTDPDGHARFDRGGAGEREDQAPRADAHATGVRGA